MKPKLFYFGLIGAVILVLSAAVWMANSSSGSGSAGAASGRPGSGRGGNGAAVAVETESVKVIDLAHRGQFNGALEPFSRFLVAGKVAGRLRKLEVNIGDLIKSGTVIARLDDEEFKLAVAQAEAELAIANANLTESEAQLDLARREFNRTSEMRRKRVASEVDLENARSQLASRQSRHELNLAQIKQREAALKAHQLRLSYTVITVNWEDTTEVRHIGERFVNEGALLSVNTPIVSVLDINRLLAVVEMPERDLPAVYTGLNAEISSGAIPEKVFFGTVSRISPGLDSATRQARVEIELDNADFLLKPGMFVQVVLQYAVHKAATVVPVSAVVNFQGSPGVFVVQQGEDGARAKFVPVTTGISNGKVTEILSPQISGNVVTLGHHLLRDGSSIILPGGGRGEQSRGEKNTADGEVKGEKEKEKEKNGE